MSVGNLFFADTNAVSEWKKKNSLLKVNQWSRSDGNKQFGFASMKNNRTLITVH